MLMRIIILRRKVTLKHTPRETSLIKLQCNVEICYKKIKEKKSCEKKTSFFERRLLLRLKFNYERRFKSWFAYEITHIRLVS